MEPENLHGRMPNLQNGVFDIATPEDFVDGYPVDEAAFWARQRLQVFSSLQIHWRKIALTVALAAAVASVAGKDKYADIANTAFALYLALVAALSVPTTDRTAHAYYTVTVAVLSTSALLILVGDALVPGSTEGVSISSGSRIPTLMLYLAASALALTTPRGPPLHFPPEKIYSAKVIAIARTRTEENVNGYAGALFSTPIFNTSEHRKSADASPLRALFFSYISKVAALPSGFGVADLPLLTANMRAVVNFAQIRDGFTRRRRYPDGVRFGYTLLRVNALPLAGVQLLSGLTATARYAPAYFMRWLLLHLESEPGARNNRWGYVYVAGLFAAGLLWSLAHIAGVRIISQTNTLLFMKTLVRKDVAGLLPEKADPALKDGSKRGGTQFVHKAQILTLMSQDVHRVSELSKHVYTLTDSPVQLVLGTWLLYSLLGVSCFVGLGATVICLPLQHFAGNIVLRTQGALMKAKDERVALTNEASGIRMIKVCVPSLGAKQSIETLKFMAWERNCEARLWGIRDKELARQKVTFTMKTVLNVIGNIIPLLFALASFGHYTFIRHEILTPSVAFTAVIFNVVQYAISGFPEALLAGLQCLVSLRRIDQYLDSPEISTTTEHSRSQGNDQSIVLSSAEITWPLSAQSDTLFTLSRLSLQFPIGELSLVCGKVGSGKSLLLLALLGEAEVVAGEVKCPCSAPNVLASFTELPVPNEWIVAGVCAYVPQTSWLRNQSIRDNILFELPFCAERYARTLKVCALVADLEILEHGDLSEVGERGINLSGGQKARVSLARAVYSRASLLILDDILSAVDVHTARHIYHACIKGDLMRGRTVILVSHHIQLCADGAAYIVALDKGTTGFKGRPADFRRSSIFQSLLQTKTVCQDASEIHSSARETSGTSHPTTFPGRANSARLEAEKGAAKPPKLVVDETSSVGRIHWDVWTAYLRACGDWNYWFWFTLILLVASFGPVFANGYLRAWADAGEAPSHRAIHYLSIYAAILCIDSGSIHASRVLYKKLLETVLFSNIRFHDTISRGIIDGFIADDFGRALKLGVSVAITFSMITAVGGLPFLTVGSALGLDYGHTSRDMRCLVSTTTSPLYSLYETAISGMINSCASHWQYGLNRWFSGIFWGINLLSMTFGGTIVALIALIILLSPTIDPSLAGMALVLAAMVSADVRAFVGLEQCLVAVERVKETSGLVREPPEILEPRPPATWPSKGEIICEDLSVRYAPDLPDVLHDINFQVSSGERWSGELALERGTLSLSFFRFVEASRGKISIDGIDIASLGLTDLRRNLTIIPQDPTLMSGTLRSTLDVFQEHEDAEIVGRLRSITATRESVFNNLDWPVSQEGGNFSAGEKQLLCIARAILKHSKTVDYATDELIGLTIREKFHGSTVLTIAHRLRSVIDYDKVMVLEEGRIVEFDRPSILLQNSHSRFYAMCKATGSNEFATLQSIAGL
ncbi:multidrug resistance-associated ABC transporter [Mycena vulgaris]|nr:multidrug resistance-associated ABC transporter [Mycena vulgaris]